MLHNLFLSLWTLFDQCVFRVINVNVAVFNIHLFVVCVWGGGKGQNQVI